VRYSEKKKKNWLETRVHRLIQIKYVEKLLAFAAGENFCVYAFYEEKIPTEKNNQTKDD